MSTFSIPSADEFANLVATIGKTGRTRQELIQKAAVVAVLYSSKDRNITPGQQLYDALSGADRKNSLVAYIEKFGNFVWSDKKLAFFENPSIRALSLDQLASVAEAMPWFEAKRAPEITSMYDVEEAFKKFIKGYETAVKQHKEIRNTDLYDALCETEAKRYARQVLGEAADKAQLDD